MTIVGNDEVRRIALEAARDAGYVGVSDAEVTTITDSLDEPSYFIRLKLGTAAPPITPYLNLKRRVSDALMARGDEYYPYISYIGATARTA